MKPSFSSRLAQLPSWLLILPCAALALAAYAQALDYPFIGDDMKYVVTNQKLAGLHWHELWRLLIEPYNATFEYLPLRDLSYWIDISLFGQNPAGYRLHNMLLYLLCLPLIYATTARLWRYFRPGDEVDVPWVAAIVTALFAIHPALVESVVWISGRKYILPDFFAMLALWLALGVRQERGFSSRHAAATLAAFVAVMFSKSSYVGVAPVIAILWLLFWLDLAPPDRKRSLLLWPVSMLLLAVPLLLVFIINNQGFDAAPAYFGTEAVTRTLAILGGLARLTVTPEARHFLYPVFDGLWFPVAVFSGGSILAATVWGGGMLLRKHSFVGFVALLFLLLCMPYLQLVPAQPPSLISDRYVALAIWPAILLITLLASDMKPRFRVLLLLSVALPWGFQTIERPRDWVSSETLVGHDWRAYPEYYMPAYLIIRETSLPGHLYDKALGAANQIQVVEIRDAVIGLINADRVLRGETMRTGDPHKAMVLLLELSRTLEKPPPRSRWDTPMLLTWKRIKVTLEEEWGFLAQGFPHNALVHYNAGLYMMDMGHYADAAINLQIANEQDHIAVSLRDAIHASLGMVYMKLGSEKVNAGHFDEAEALLNASLKQPGVQMQAYCLLADMYKQSNRPQEAFNARIKCPLPQ